MTPRESDPPAQPSKGPALFVVATPIGNLDDLTPRARGILAAVDLIAAEDTRVTGRLLQLAGIGHRPLVAYHDHNEADRAATIVARMLRESLSVALVSDAGTPAVADPGFRLVAAARAAGIVVHPVPGASAPLALASAAGLPTDRLLFVGFLPERESPRRAEVASWGGLRATVAFLAPTRQLGRDLAAIAAAYPAARVAIGRELTKLHEEIVVLPVEEAVAWVAAHKTLRGEATVLVDVPRPDAGAAVDVGALQAEAARAFGRGATLRELLLAYRDRGLSRAELYALLLAAKGESVGTPQS